MSSPDQPHFRLDPSSGIGSEARRAFREELGLGMAELRDPDLGDRLAVHSVRKRLKRLQMRAYLEVFVRNGRILQLLSMVPKFTPLVFHMILKQLGLFRVQRVRRLPPPPNMKTRLRVLGPGSS